MIETERQKLLAWDSEYLSIGVTEGGIPRGMVEVPWENTAHAYNMRIPQVYLEPKDLRDEEILARLRRFRVIGCYVWAPLAEYSVLAQFPDLRDLNIVRGDGLRDLDFLAELRECRMLFLGNARLKNLDVILDAKRRSSGVLGCFQCVGLYRCEVEDLSRLETETCRFFEFLVWDSAEKQEKSRWKAVPSNVFRYYEL